MTPEENVWAQRSLEPLSTQGHCYLVILPAVFHHEYYKHFVIKYSHYRHFKHTSLATRKC